MIIETRKDPHFWRNRLNIKELQKEIIRMLKENDGEMKMEEVCDTLGIVSYDIPWGHNIGWAKCLQPNQKYHLILSGGHKD